MDFAKFVKEIEKTFQILKFSYEVDPHGLFYAAKDFKGNIIIFYDIKTEQWRFLIAEGGKPFAQGAGESPQHIRLQVEDFLNTFASMFGFRKKATL